MNTLKIDTGLAEFQLNDACTVSFNPTDLAFIQKIYSAFEDMDIKQEQYKAELAGLKDAGKMFELMRSKDEEMRKTVDGVFGSPVCDAVFKDTNMFALTRDGLPLWANLFLVIIDQCDAEAKELQGKAPNRLNKYLNKYHK